MMRLQEVILPAGWVSLSKSRRSLKWQTLTVWPPSYLLAPVYWKWMILALETGSMIVKTLVPFLILTQNTGPMIKKQSTSLCGFTLGQGFAPWGCSENLVGLHRIPIPCLKEGRSLLSILLLLLISCVTSSNYFYLSELHIWNGDNNFLTPLSNERLKWDNSCRVC